MSKRPRGYITDYNPQKKTRALIADVKAVLAEYRDSLPLTVRQVFYRLVGTRDYPKDERAYGRLCNHLNNARRAGLIPFSAIRDDGVLGGPPSGHYSDGSDFWDQVRRLARRAELDALAPQPVRVEVLCEAAGMLNQVLVAAS